MDRTELRNRFQHHPPQDEAIKLQHKTVRDIASDYAQYLNETLPEGREKSLAITHLEETMLWANTAIARNQG